MNKQSAIPDAAGTAAPPWRRHDESPTALYIHIPFCRRLCPYCDFAIAKYGGDIATRYLDALAAELADIENTANVSTVFLGGGTPSMLSTAENARLFDALSSTVDLNSVEEMTIECNPADVDRAMVRRLVERGVNRFSLGAQSFDDKTLVALGRDHDGDEARRAAEVLLGEAVPSVSLDLIFGAPGTTAETFSHDLDVAIGLGVHHVSVYGLTYESGTQMTRWRDDGTIEPVSDSIEADMYAMAITTLGEAGLRHYEISNFAKPGHESRHNLTYWRGEPYHAAGMGATSYVNGARTTRERRLHAYLSGIESGAPAIAESTRLDARPRARERLAFGLRLVDGIPIEPFARATGVSPLEIASEELERFAEAGLIELHADRVVLTRRGLLVADTVMSELI